MAIKAKIKPLLPPTERTFSAKISSLENQLGIMESRIIELERLCNAQAQSLDAYTRLTAELLQTSIYSNSEYSNPDRRRNILIAGWYGANNFGDELMMRTVLEHFSENALASINVLLWDNDTYSRLNLPPEVGVIHYPKSTWQLEELVELFDIIVWGGGSILDDEQFNDDPRNINTGNLFIRLNILAESRGKEVWCLGLGTNHSFSDERYLRYLQEIIDGSSYFSVRDPESLETLVNNGIDCSRVQLCNDIAFASKELRSIAAKPQLDAQYKLGIVCLCTEDLFEHYVTVLQAILQTLPQKDDAEQIALIPFLDEKGSDDACYRRLKHRLGDSPSIAIARYSNELSNCALLKCNSCICYKYHASLIANALGIPGLHVVHSEHPHYQNKMTHISKVFGYSSHLIDTATFESNTATLAKAALNDNTPPLLENHAIYSETEAWLQEVCGQIEGGLAELSK